MVEQEDWLYMEAGDDVPAEEMARRLTALKAVGQPMVTRAQVGSHTATQTLQLVANHPGFGGLPLLKSKAVPPCCVHTPQT